MKIDFNTHTVYTPNNKGEYTILVSIDNHILLHKGIFLVEDKETEEQEVVIAGLKVTDAQKEVIVEHMMTAQHNTIAPTSVYMATKDLTGFTTEEEYVRFLVPYTIIETGRTSKKEKGVNQVKVHLNKLVDTQTNTIYNKQAELEARRLEEAEAKERKKARLLEMRLEQKRKVEEIEAENLRIKKELRVKKAAARRAETLKQKEAEAEEAKKGNAVAVGDIFDSLINMNN